mmetsp:Transcript_16117/g.23904  ORF Transcript_16117/g.23904 Transcript_16117/m.23904 type:complete len:190 (+) Transcript_16117:33-602(+)
MGTSTSSPTRLDIDFGSADLAEIDERYYGFENFGNTCYCNSVLQAFYFCLPLREKLLELAKNIKEDESEGEMNLPRNTIIYHLTDLFSTINGMKKISGCVAPTEFLRALRDKNELFRGNMQQDAHEFFNFLINDMADVLTILTSKDARGEIESAKSNWIRELFQGILTNETRCICCETVSSICIVLTMT